MSPTVLGQALAMLPPQHDPNLLVDTSTADDAGVYKLTEEMALVQPVDFFTPIVDNPYTFGRISAAQPGDLLVLTKPIGTGILATALKRGKGTPELLERMAETMWTLNDVAGQAMVEHGAHAATDITGFGLIGHACEMARGSKVALR